MADNSDQVMLRDRFEIKPASRLSQFDQSMHLAYAVEDHSHPGRKLFALICPGTVPARGLNIPERKNPIPMLWPEASGIVDWPVAAPNGEPVWGRRPAIVYPQPTGERLAKDDAAALPRLNEQTIVRTIIKPAMVLLRELGQMGIAHRAIRPSNIFYTAGNSGEIMFGEFREKRFAPPPLLKRMVLAGRFGRKSGRGFFEYDEKGNRKG